MSIESSTTEDGGEGEVRVSTVIRASRETVFGILSDPARFSDWIQGEAAFAAEAGSPFRVHFRQFDTVVSGEILEVVADQRLVLTWGVAEGPQVDWFPPGSSRVEIDLEPTEEGTRVSLRHSGLPEKEVGPHQGGWRFHLSRLELKANRSGLMAVLPATLDRWCEAWQEADPDRRGEILGTCVAEQIEYADEYAQLKGSSQLSLHIGNSLQYMPWTRMEVGAPTICRGEAVTSWRLVGDDGEVVEQGLLHCHLDLEGLLTRVTTFWGAPQG